MSTRSRVTAGTLAGLLLLLAVPGEALAGTTQEAAATSTGDSFNHKVVAVLVLAVVLLVGGVIGLYATRKKR